MPLGLELLTRRRARDHVSRGRTSSSRRDFGPAKPHFRRRRAGRQGRSKRFSGVVTKLSFEQGVNGPHAVATIAPGRAKLRAAESTGKTSRAKDWPLVNAMLYGESSYGGGLGGVTRRGDGACSHSAADDNVGQSIEMGKILQVRSVGLSRGMRCSNRYSALDAPKEMYRR